MNQIFITSGSSNTSEILDVSQIYDSCGEAAPYPQKVDGAIGTFIGDRPLVCGGRSSVEDYFNDCFFYNVKNDSWSLSEPMKERRYQVGEAIIFRTFLKIF